MRTSPSAGPLVSAKPTWHMLWDIKLAASDILDCFFVSFIFCKIGESKAGNAASHRQVSRIFERPSRHRCRRRVTREKTRTKHSGLWAPVETAATMEKSKTLCCFFPQSLG